MNKTRVCILFLTLLTTAGSVLTSVAQSYSFKSLGIDQGLCQSRITRVIQDNYGTFWVGTRIGLNKISNNQVHVYPNNTNGLVGEYISAIHCDPYNNVWVATQQSLALYDYTDDGFTNVSGNSQINFHSLVDTPVGLLAASDEMIGVYNYNTATLDTLVMLDESKISCHKLLATNDSRLLIADSRKGLFALDLQTKQIRSIEGIELPVAANTLTEDSRGRIWIARNKDELDCYEFKDDRCRRIKLFDRSNSPLGNYRITDMAEYDQQLWIASDGGGIYIYNMRDLSWKTLKHIDSNNNSMPANAVSSLYATDNAVYAGMVRSGVVRIKESYLHTYRSAPAQSPYGLSNQTVISLCQGDNGTVWIGTDGGGVNSFDPHTKLFRKYPLTSDMSVTSIDRYSEGLLLLTVYDSPMLLFDTRNGTLRKFNTRNTQLDAQLTNGQTAYIKLIDQQHITLFGGLCATLDTSNGSMKPLSCADSIGGFCNLIESNNNRMVLLGSNSVYRIDRNSGKETLIYKNDQRIRSLAIDKRDNLWFSDDSGLKHYNPATEQCATISLPYSTRIPAMAYDNHNRLWLAHLGGLFCYIIDQQRFAIIDKDDGAETNEYYGHAVLKADNGDVYIGGSSGLLVIEHGIDPQAYLSKVDKVNLLSVMVDQRYIPKQEWDNLSVGWDFNIMFLNVALTHNNMGNKPLLKYRIVGRNNMEIETSDSRLVIPAMQSGTYHVMLSHMTKSGQWSDEQQIMQFTVNQPFWWQWWMIAIYSAIISTITILIYSRRKLKTDLMIKDHDRQLSEDKVRFLINISHELRTPLTLIYTPIQQLYRQSSIDNEEHKIIGKVLFQANKMTQLVNMILDARRMEKGGGAIDIAPHNLDNWIESVVQQFTDHFAMHSMTLVYQPKDTKGELNFDLHKCEIVLSNLLMNAVKYGRDNTTVVIESSISNNGRLRICVIDSGTGIEGDPDKLFERFVQSSYRNVGYGIGLSYSKMLIEMQNGQIGAYNNANGVGSTFWFELPIDAAPCTRQIDRSEYLNRLICPLMPVGERSARQTRIDLKNYSLLVVEDEKDVAAMIFNTYHAKFKTVYLATNGREGLEAIEKYRPDIVVSDVMMPEMDGFEMCKAVKTDVRISHIPVILLTARDDAESINNGYKRGADSYLVKPFDTDFLLTLIVNNLSVREEVKNHYRNSPIMPVVEQSTFSSADEKFMNKLNSFIIQNIADSRLDVKAITDYMGMSRASLYNKMKSVAGQGINIYITKLRMQHACELLRQTNIPVGDVATMAGYSDSNYFSTSFRQVFKIAPSEYRKQHRNDE